MPVANITDVDEFTDPVQYPIDGTAADGTAFAVAPQDLANRTRNNKNRIDALQTVASYSTVASGVAPGGTVGLTETLNNSGFSLVSNAIEVPAAGTYLVTLDGGVSSNSASNPAALGMNIRVGGASIRGFSVIRFSTDTALVMDAHTHVIVTIATPATERITLTANGVGDLTLGSFLTVLRLY